MFTSNGVIKKESETSVISSKEVRKRRLLESGQDFPLEGFRGFKKVPIVNLLRYDITPYVHSPKNNSSAKSAGQKTSIHSKRLAQKCTVKLDNQDLLKLKKTWANQPGTSTELTSDSDNGIMANIKCNICDKKYSSEKKLLKHQENKHMLVYKSHDKPQKRVSFSDHVIVHEVKEYHKCRKCPKIFEGYKLLKTHMKELHRKQAVEFVDVTAVDAKSALDDTVTVEAKTALAVEAKTAHDDKITIEICNSELKKPIVHPKSKKTIISRHQCQTCSKYFSSNYCLKRHMESQHLNFDSLQCKVCEETFVWPSLLKSHKCIRLNHPEMPFEDARPEIHFDNLHEMVQNGFDDLNITDNDDYLNTLDFEIPAPIVELKEYESLAAAPDKFAPFANLGYKVVVQEVPIEF